MIISWINYHGRSADLAGHLGVTAEFIAPEERNLLGRYLKASIRTGKLIRGSKTPAVIVMLPPTPALIVALLAKRRNTVFVADCHTGFFLDPKWTRFTRLSLRLLKKHAVIVTNDSLARKAEQRGVKAFVVHDLLTDKIQPSAQTNTQFTVLCPLSYASDEPIDAILECATLSPKTLFIFTGRSSDSVRSRAPANVTFTGYLSNESYNTMLDEASCVLALTLRDLTMQRAGYEALMKGKPQITSSFDVLRNFYGDAAVYADPLDPSSISSAVKTVSESLSTLRANAEHVLGSRIRDQELTLEALGTHLTVASSTGRKSIV